MVEATDQDILQLVTADAWMMDVLRHAQSLDLPDWWVCAGFVRSKVWDTLHGYERTTLPDIDVVYYDASCLEEHIEKELEERLHARAPGLPWSVKNQARMHIANGEESYASSTDAISKFPETATALGVRLDKRGRLELTAPCGVEDAWGLIVRPTPHFAATPERMAVYRKRVAKKQWQAKWPRVVEL